MISNSQKDFWLLKKNQVRLKTIKNHDIICIEDLNTKGLLYNHKLAKSIADVS